VGRVSALLLADGGAKELNPPDWIAALQPQFVLISVDAAGRAERPAPEVLDALNNYSILRMDQNGWIRQSTDSEKM
jgi:beta-lactamase superfamily II metal-dependent hydrolase